MYYWPKSRHKIANGRHGSAVRLLLAQPSCNFLLRPGNWLFPLPLRRDSDLLLKLVACTIESNWHMIRFLILLQDIDAVQALIEVCYSDHRLSAVTQRRFHDAVCRLGRAWPGICRHTQRDVSTCFAKP